MSIYGVKKPEILFKVINADTLHEFVIYDTGEIEGFGEGRLTVVNYFPIRVAELRCRLERAIAALWG